MAGHPDQCPLVKVSHGEALPRGPACKSMFGLRCQRAPFWWCGRACMEEW